MTIEGPAPAGRAACPGCTLPLAVNGKPHCGEEHTTCTWLTCSRCRTVYDLVTKRSFSTGQPNPRPMVGPA